MTLLANYEEERDHFRQLLGQECQKQILLFQGKSGTGKTSLINACLAEIASQKEKILHVPIQLRSSAVSVPEIFYRLGDHVGWGHLKQFITQVNAFQKTPTINIDNNKMLGQNQIEVALHAENPTDRAHRRAALTRAWFDDLSVYTHPILIVMDTYEDATTEVREWIDSPFLARVARSPNLRVLLAGQRVPDETNIEWGRCCQKRDLFGVHEASHWMPVVEAMNRVIVAPDPLSWLGGICHVLNGQPSEIKKIIENLPQQDAQ